MAHDMQPLKLWGHPFVRHSSVTRPLLHTINRHQIRPKPADHTQSPNPLKVLIILCALELPYEITPSVLYEAKEEWYTDMNPNGRLPTLEDPNNDSLVLWESGAIIQYLIDRYDEEGKLSHPGSSNEKYREFQWAHFQMSGQGPYFGQLVWFSNVGLSCVRRLFITLSPSQHKAPAAYSRSQYHIEQLPSAIERYKKEQDRVFSVIDLHLSRTKTAYLIGDKCSYADLMFVPWQRSNKMLPTSAFIDDVLPEKYPLAHAWRMRLLEHKAVKEAMRIASETKIPEKIS